MTIKKGNKKVTFIISISVIILLILFLAYELIARNTGLKSLMGNSVTSGFYYCEDASYTLNDNKCVKTQTTESGILGDVNLDGAVDDNDINLLNRYLAKTATLTDLQLVAADVNSDGIISVGDAENIRLYVNGHNTGSEYLSKIGTSSVCPKNYNLNSNLCVQEIRVNAKEANYKRGDINLDGNIDSQDIKLLNKYLKKQVNLTTVQLNVADFNGNGIIDINDLNELQFYLNDYTNSTNVIGDINLDGTVDSNDVIMLNKYVIGEIKLTKEQLKYADIDTNGVIDATDIEQLARKISDFYQVGDINMDGNVDISDLTILQDGLNSAVSVNKVQLNLCDINGDGTIDNNDAMMLRSKVISVKKYKKGDANMDGKTKNDDVTIIENYVLGKTTLTIDQMTLADYNNDGVIDNNDANALAKAIASNYQVGDINMDGKVSMLDINMLNKYITKVMDLDTVQKLLADTNGDGKINAKDLE